MRGRWNANTWVLTILGIIIVLVGFDLTRQMLFPRPDSTEAATPPPGGSAPGFKVGDQAPDFTLPDRKGVKHTLSEVVKRDTLLCFTCGCSSCRYLQNFLGTLVKQLKDRAPDVISITTSMPEAEAAYRRDVKLEHVILYDRPRTPDAKEPTVMDLYKGHPCPRVYAVDGQRKVKWIGTSPAEVPAPQHIGMELARNLGLDDSPSALMKSAVDAKKSGPPAPPAPGAPKPAGTGAAVPGHSPDDGHGH